MAASDPVQVRLRLAEQEAAPLFGAALVQPRAGETRRRRPPWPGSPVFRRRSACGTRWSQNTAAPAGTGTCPTPATTAASSRIVRAMKSPTHGNAPPARAARSS